MNRIFLHITLFLVLVATSNMQAQESLYPKTVSNYHNDWTKGHYKERIATFQEAPLTHGGIVFIGNSITEQGKDWNEKFDTTQIYNRGIAGDVTDGVLLRLDEVIHSQPSKIFILIGINDLFSVHHKEDTRDLHYEQFVPSANYVAKNILAVVNQLHTALPETKIYVRTVLPTRETFLKKDILKVNRFLKKHAKDGSYTLIDLYSEFVDDNGLMTASLTRDGVHLTPEGYAKWVAFETPYISE
ncbi:Lysophospholipase L1 [Pustulibacterium marinum]|uniref:Lysophospholipase L1 n=1 Tax=Pustulibacterium marinum TaxID=1224947 RepID=A0A1I7H006_9FLAO|nr:GDSL-type esterase/lipase family protein [Pustulibacterium marinum]SFU54005.1 Lysophospholipase L1 [Pustulibacterium marinum]